MNSMDIFEWLARFGYTRKHAGSPRAKYQDYVRGDEKLVITLRGKNGFSWFFNNATGEHGSVLKLVQIEMGLPSIGHAKKEIRALCGSGQIAIKTRAPKSTPSSPKTISDFTNTQSTDDPDPLKIDLSRKWQSFKDMDSPLDRYLLKRGLSRETIDEFYSELKIDFFGNPCFRHKIKSRVTGWEYKDVRPNIELTSKFSKGGIKSFFSHRVGTQIRFIVITEGAIKSMAFHQLFPAEGVLHIAAAGRYSKFQESLLVQLFEALPDAKIVCAADNDAAGEGYFELLKNMVAPERMIYRRKPEGVKDWDDLLVKG